MGKQMRKYLVEETGLLSPEFNKDQIYVRSTDVNRTIDSALSQLQGLYEGAAPFKLEEQQESILPPFGVREEVIQETKENMGASALPNDMAVIPVHVPTYHHDEYNPQGICKPLTAAHHHYTDDSYISETLTEKYADHVAHYGKHFFDDDFYFTALMELGSSDTVHSHWFDRRETPGIDDQFISTMMDLRRDYFIHKNCAADWMPKVYTSKTLKTLLLEFQGAIDMNEQGRADEPSRRRFFYWSDHDTGVQNFACLFDFVFEIYIPFDSQLLFQLYSEGNSKYSVGMTVNGQVVKMQGACGGQEKCDFDLFSQLVGDISYVNDDAKWDQECLHGGKEYEESFMTKLNQFVESASMEQLEMEYLEDLKL